MQDAEGDAPRTREADRRARMTAERVASARVSRAAKVKRKAPTPTFGRPPTPDAGRYGNARRPKSSASQQRVDPYRWLSASASTSNLHAGSWPSRPSEWFYTRPSTPMARSPPQTPGAGARRAQSALGMRRAGTPPAQATDPRPLTVSLSVVNTPARPVSPPRYRPFGKHELESWQSQPHIGEWLESVKSRKDEEQHRRYAKAIKDIKWIEWRRSKASRDIASRKLREAEDRKALQAYQRRLKWAAMMALRRFWKQRVQWRGHLADAQRKAIEFAHNMYRRRGIRAWQHYVKVLKAKRAKREGAKAAAEQAKARKPAAAAPAESADEEGGAA